jgi:hypothetical protein
VNTTVIQMISHTLKKLSDYKDDGVSATEAAALFEA